MPQCPVCTHVIEDDFGLVTCPSCGAQVMIDMNSSVGEALPQIPPQALKQARKEISQIIQEEVLEQEGLEEAPFDIEAPLNIEASLNVETESASPAIPVSSDMSDIADFGNSISSQGREGMLRFNLFIAGIDSSEIRTLVLDALSDSRFLWDAEQIMTSIVHGELQLKEVTAVKSAIVVQRLRTVPVEIRWEQYAIFQN